MASLQSSFFWPYLPGGKRFAVQSVLKQTPGQCFMRRVKCCAIRRAFLCHTLIAMMIKKVAGSGYFKIPQEREWECEESRQSSAKANLIGDKRRAAPAACEYGRQ